MATGTFTVDTAPGKGRLIQRLRLWTGLILFTYVFFHYLNHSLGHVSLSAMEAMLDLQEAIVGSLVGLAILYGALVCHVALALWRIVRLRSWRRPFWEWSQILLGLAIPWLLYSHLTYTRGAEQLLGVNGNYQRELLLLWPGAAIQQSALLLIVWAHACIGLHFWLRLRNWYPRAFPILAGLALLVPATALTGWISAARRLVQDLQLGAARSEETREALAELLASNQYILNALRPVEQAGQWVIIAILATMTAIVAARWYLQRFGKRVRVTYGEGPTVADTPGRTLLEISRNAGIPHMSVCGGRARCSTCRTVILEGAQNISPPTEAEVSLLQKFDAGSEIRLACQSRINGDVKVRPMIQAKSGLLAPRRTDPLGWGMERELAIMFVDVRGFSRISENALPYDVVFMLNSLFDEVGNAIEAANGYIDKFMGDGIMALFGLSSTPQRACRDALRAALDAHQATARASKTLANQLDEPLRIGIGIHFGQVVVGRVGKTSDQVMPSRLTAIGETVNIAARLETASKEFGVGLVISGDLADAASIDIPEPVGTRSIINVRNISEPVSVYSINDIDGLDSLIIPEPGERKASKSRRRRSASKTLTTDTESDRKGAE